MNDVVRVSAERVTSHDRGQTKRMAAVAAVIELVWKHGCATCIASCAIGTSCTSSCRRSGATSSETALLATGTTLTNWACIASAKYGDQQRNYPLPHEREPKDAPAVTKNMIERSDFFTVDRHR